MLKNAVKTLLGVIAACAAALAFIHFVNRRIFSRSAGKNTLSHVWKSDYGDVAFTREGKGTPVLIVHGIGIGAGSSEWKSNIQELAKSHTVYALDLPGFGNSEKRKITYSSYYYAKVINDFIYKIVGRRTSVVASDMSCGFVLAGAKLSPKLYNKIIIVNPYAVGMGAKYARCPFAKAVLPMPIIGTLFYNFISSKRSILSFLGGTAPITESFGSLSALMEKKHRNAHLFGANNKYAIISLLNGYLYTNVFGLIKSCPTALSVVVSGGGATPFIPAFNGVTVTQIEVGELYPNIYSSGEFNDIVRSFIGSSVPFPVFF